MEPDDIDEALAGAEELHDVLDDLEARSRSFGTALTSALKGAVLDFKDGLQGAGFSIENPNASRTCGCGQSFS